jgi:hypothetical protein
MLFDKIILFYMYYSVYFIFANSWEIYWLFTSVNFSGKCLQIFIWKFYIAFSNSYCLCLERYNSVSYCKYN